MTEIVCEMNNRTVFDETNKIWSGEGGASLPKWNPKVSLGSALLSALAKFPDKIGQVNFRFRLFSRIKSVHVRRGTP